MRTSSFRHFFMNLFLLLFISALILIVSSPVISFDMIYPEQTLIYTANASIHTWRDLLNVYLHPQLFHFVIPFFRPSGHFLIYQLLSPLLGWENTQAYITVNVIFLCLSAFMMIKIYEILFPSFRVGGFIAASTYVMHPALNLSRLIVLHFEFAYVFLTLLSLYCFIKYCHNNLKAQINKDSSFNSAYLFLISIMTYMLAVTFKEPAIMLGPVMFAYYFIYFYRGNIVTYTKSLIHHKASIQLLLLLTVVTLVTATYMTLAWPTIRHPTRNHVAYREMLLSASAFFTQTIGLSHYFFGQNALPSPTMIWRGMVSSPIISSIMILQACAFIISLILMAFRRDSHFIKSVSFLLVACLLFLVIPIMWAMALPWHLNLSLVFFTLVIGFGVDYVLKFSTNRIPKWNAIIGYSFAFFIAVTAIDVNKANISRYTMVEHNAFVFKILNNAIHRPPAIKSQLNNASILVVEDQVVNDNYFLGNSLYPFYLTPTVDFNQLAKAQSGDFVKIDLNYNSYLFRWAYNAPNLREELLHFSVSDLSAIPEMILYTWNQHMNNLFCVGYTKSGLWVDKTNELRAQVKREVTARKMIVNRYQSMVMSRFVYDKLTTKEVAFPDPHYCQQLCDKNASCGAVNYEVKMVQNKKTQSCELYGLGTGTEMEVCPMCITYVKLG